MNDPLRDNLCHKIITLKDEIAKKYAEKLYEFSKNSIYSNTITYLDLFKNSYIDITKLYSSIITNNNNIYKDYVLWRCDVFKSRKIDLNIIYIQIDILRDILNSYFSTNEMSIFDEIFTYTKDKVKELISKENQNEENLELTDDICKNYLRYLLNKDKENAIILILNLYEKTKDVRMILQDVIYPVQKFTGILWQKNIISVSDEHYITETSKEIMDILILNAYKKPKNNKTIVSVCGYLDLHDMGLRFVSNFLKLEGYNIIYFGLNTPNPSIIQFIKDYSKIDGLLISSTLTISLLYVKDLISDIKEYGFDNIKIMTGGLSFDENPILYKVFGADGYSANGVECVELANRLILNS